MNPQQANVLCSGTTGITSPLQSYFHPRAHDLAVLACARLPGTPDTQTKIELSNGSEKSPSHQQGATAATPNANRVRVQFRQTPPDTTSVSNTLTPSAPAVSHGIYTGQRTSNHKAANIMPGYDSPLGLFSDMCNIALCRRRPLVRRFLLYRELRSQPLSLKAIILHCGMYKADSMARLGVSINDLSQ